VIVPAEQLKAAYGWEERFFFSSGQKTAKIAKTDCCPRPSNENRAAW
jgi:hypothetical protein